LTEISSTFQQGRFPFRLARWQARFEKRRRRQASTVLRSRLRFNA
jgi:hypothetical protein